MSPAYSRAVVANTIDNSQTLNEVVVTDVYATIRVPQLSLVFRCDRPTEPGVRLSLADLDELTIGRGVGGIKLERDDSGQFVAWRLRDDLMSRVHVRVSRESGGWMLTDLKSKNGSFIGGRRIVQEQLRDGDFFRVGSAIFMFRYADVCLERKHIGAHFADDSKISALSTLIPDLEMSWQQAAGLAQTDLPLLILGETGVGKELIARELHARSSRLGRWVAVNCGAIPETLIESEFFGHCRGAFSGALDDQVGLLRRAHRGTLFLDEVAELSEGGQVALLRVLQEQEVRPVGSTDPIAVDIRIIAATHRDLEASVTQGRFREDLYARLAGHAIRVPPLRHRREDLGLIVSQILRGKLAEFAVTTSFSATAAMALLTHPFPRNIRELEHILCRAIALANGGRVRSTHLPKDVSEHLPEFVDKRRAAALDDYDLERRLIATLRETNGNISETGRRFGKAPIQIRRWLKRFDIDVNRFRRSA